MTGVETCPFCGSEVTEAEDPYNIGQWDVYCGVCRTKYRVIKQ